MAGDSSVLLPLRLCSSPGLLEATQGSRKPQLLCCRELALCTAIHQHGAWARPQSLLHPAEPQWEGIHLLGSLEHGEKQN